MFKKTKIAAVTAAVLGMSSMVFAPNTQAVTLNESSSGGQVLIFPYYNVNNGFSTAFNIINTTTDTKAIKIRFRESKLSNDILDFNLYMSPNDFFSMQVVNVNGEAVLKTSDKSCTFPAIKAAGEPFRGHEAYDLVEVADEREGYLEVIEMGVVTDSKVQDGVLHNAEGVPDDCEVVFEAWKAGDFEQGGAKANVGQIHNVDPIPTGYQNLNRVSQSGWYGIENVPGLSKPTGGLVGTSVLLNVKGSQYSAFVAEPTVIVNYSDRAQHYLSSDENLYLLPSLASGSVQQSHTLADNFKSVKTINWPYVRRDWGLDDQNVRPRRNVPSGINPMPIAHAMAVTTLSNQFFTDDPASSASAKTDWVIATPMRKHGIYNNYQYKAGAAGFNDEKDIPVDQQPNATDGYWQQLGGTDISATLTYFDREEGIVETSPQDFSPPLKTAAALVDFSREVNIMSFEEGKSVLGTADPRTVLIEPGFVSGWGTFNFENLSLTSSRYTAWLGGSVQGTAIGVPINGFAAAQGEIRSTGAQFGETFPHAYQRKRGN